MAAYSSIGPFFQKKSFSLVLLSVLILLLSCQTIPAKREIRKVEEITGISNAYYYIKAHMKDGKVYILHQWRFDSRDSTLNGFGSLLGINRNVLESRNGSPGTTAPVNSYTPHQYPTQSDSIVHVYLQPRDGEFKINLSDIALIETNDTGHSLAGGLAVVTGITAIVSLACILNPKACFGSCPTFYAFDGDTMALQAEGFSTSVSPSFEKRDIDMLYAAKPTKDFELVVTNEALETHSIRHANLLVFEKKDYERVFADPQGKFYKCPEIIQPTQCQNQGGSCLEKVMAADGNELFSQTDPENLDSKEEILVSFNVDTKENIGLVIGKRQTLLTTYLMYQTLAYMGKSTTYWMAKLEREKMGRVDGIFQLLGGIEIFSKDSNGQWKSEGTLNETGPIATDFNIIPLSGHHQGTLELKLRLNKGLWRIDYLGLASISDEVFPSVVSPADVEVISGTETDPLARLLNENEFLVTYPGDAYRIVYHLPFENAELFLDSKGYYLEWIREEWITDQSFAKLNMMVNNCPRYLKKAAPAFKKLEPSMEDAFWNSKYVKK